MYTAEVVFNMVDVPAVTKEGVSDTITETNNRPSCHFK